MPHIHPVLIDFKGVEVLNIDPVGNAGLAMQNNFKILAGKFPVFTEEIQWSAATIQDILLVPDSRVVSAVEIYVLEAFDGVGAALKVGTPVTDDLFFETVDSDLTALDLTFCKSFSVIGPVTVRVTLVPGASPTVGKARVVVTTTPAP